MMRPAKMFTIAEISAATGRTKNDISLRIRRHHEAGSIPDRPRGKRGAPAQYSYEEVMTILLPVRAVQKDERGPDAPELDEAKVRWLRHQLQTDGFTVY